MEQLSQSLSDVTKKYQEAEILTKKLQETLEQEGENSKKELSDNAQKVIYA